MFRAPGPPQQRHMRQPDSQERHQGRLKCHLPFGFRTHRAPHESLKALKRHVISHNPVTKLTVPRATPVESSFDTFDPTRSAQVRVVARCYDGGRVHRTLRRSTNLVLIVIWTIVAAALFLMYPEDAGVPMVAGAVIGLVTGLCQGLALASNPVAFFQAASAVDVRRQLTSSWFGKLSIAVLWLGAAVIGWLVWNLSRGYLLGTFAAGYVALMLVRELSTFPFLCRIESVNSSPANSR